MLLRLMLLLALTPLLTACSTTTMVSDGTSCLAWRPITWSRKDTAQTVVEVKANNARRKSYCEDQS